MNILFFQKSILLTDFRTENIQSEKRRVKFTVPKEVQEPYACTEKVMAYQKGLRRNDFSEYRKAWGDPPPPAETTHYTSPSCQVMILTVKSGEIYRITRKSSSPMRDDCPTVIQGVFRKGVRAKEPMKHEIGVRPDRRPADIVELVFSDGRTEEATLTVSKPPQIAVQSEVEITDHSTAADIEKLILHECDTEKEFQNKTDPSMREFYLEYVQGPDTLKAIAKRFGRSERTLKNRKEELEKHMARKPRSMNLNLHKLKHDPLMREARRYAGKDPVEKLRKKQSKNMVRIRLQDSEAQSEIEKAERLEEEENRRRNEEKKRQFSKG